MFPQVTSTILRRRAQLVHKLCEIRVFRHQQCAGSTRGVEDVEVGSALQRQVADADAVDPQVGTHKGAERGR